MNSDVFLNPPIGFYQDIPIFSKEDEYTKNYEKISSDHLSSFQKDGTNPFIPEELWLETEYSTRDLIKKYSKPGQMILDVGVGLGRLMDMVPDLKRFGMDISWQYLIVAKSKGIEVCYSKIEDMPYSKGIFDVITCTDVLEHVLDLNLAVNKMLSVLKPGGVLIIRVPFREDLSHYIKASYPYRYVHVRSFDEYSLELMFDRIFNCKILEKTFAGYYAAAARLKCARPLLLDKAILFFMHGLKMINKTLQKRMLKIFFYPDIINVVLKRN